MASHGKYMGDITLEMIDDFLSPTNRGNNEIKCLPASATGGLGFMGNDENEEEDSYYVPFRQKYDKALAPIDANYPLAYIHKAEALNQNDDAKSQYRGAKSIAELSQIESVTTVEGARSLLKTVHNTYKPQNLNDLQELCESINNLSSKCNEEGNSQVYHAYNLINNHHKYNENLKITKNRDEILGYISSYPVCIIRGGTGCGKTTQVPQYILDQHAQNDKYCSIIVTQPRRIAAISVANRVCNERGWTLGTICGYQIGLDRKYISEDTRISYVTTGILLQKLINKHDIGRYTHIIIDEVHERDLDVDFVLLILKLLVKNNANIRVILMSATIDCNIFSKYYSRQIVSNGKLSPAPIHEIMGETYQVKEFYLDHLLSEDNIFGVNKKYKLDKMPNFSMDEPQMFELASLMVIELLKYFDDLEREQVLTAQTRDSKQRIIQGFPTVRGSVLIFVPGMRQIQELEDLIRSNMPNSNLNILPLHSEIVIEQQKRAFEPPKETKRKIIISTSIAESSITVPDIKYVIDFCLTKELWCDLYTNYTHLRLEWATKSSLNQRKGRAGRVSDGTCYRLISENFFKRLDDQNIPAINRVPLSKLVLNVKKLKLKCNEPKRLLALAINPPDLEDIDRTILLLKEAGALTIEPSSTDGELTYVGNIMASLPIDIKLAKLILLGHTFGKLHECIIIAAALSTKTFFVRYFKSHLEAFSAKYYWSQGTFCDCLTILNAYNLWENYYTKGKFPRDSDMEQWAKSNMIDLYRIKEVKALKTELEKRLKEFNIIDNKYCNEEKRFYERNNLNDNHDEFDIDDESDVERHHLILKIIIAGAFYPNYFQSTVINEYEASKMISGQDIKNAVMIKGLPMNQGILYHSKLMEMFSFCSKYVQIHYEDTKAYIEFKSSYEEVNTSINFGVYLAINMRLLRLPLLLPRLKDGLASNLIAKFNKERRTEKIKSIMLKTNSARKSHRGNASSNDEDSDEGSNFSDDNSFMNRSVYSSNIRSSSLLTPTANKRVELLSNPERLLQKLRNFSIVITEIVECGHFWAQINEDSYTEALMEIQVKLNSDSSHKLTHFNSMNSLCVGMLVATAYVDAKQERFLYRAKILHIDKERQLVQVLFVDYGNKEVKRFNQLLVLNDDLYNYPFQAIECKLIKLQINKLKCPNGVWSKAANNYFAQLVSDKQLQASVFSIVNNVVRIDLFERKDDGNINNSSTNINELLIKSGFAEPSDESQMSKLNSSQIFDDDYIAPAATAASSLSSINVLNEDLRNNNNRSTRNLNYEMMSELNDSLVSLDLLKENDEILSTKSRRSEMSKSSNTENKTIYSQYLESAKNVNEDIQARQEKYDGTIKLNGPYSPLEVTYHPIVNIGKLKCARVERDSINFVTLDDDPRNEFERLLISADISLNMKGDGMMLRGTTLMPKIRGLSSLLCILFTPTCEVRLSPDKKSFTGALCGLGYDKNTKQPLYNDDDIECTFDIKIGFEEFKMINTVRMAINMIIGSEEEAKNWANEPRHLRNLQQKACNRLLELISKERTPVEPKYFHKYGRWCQLKDHEVVILSDDLKFENYLYSSHNVAVLRDDFE